MPALFPSTVAPEVFKPGDHVRKFVSDQNVSPYSGVVTHVVPSTYKVWVEWPLGSQQEDPAYLVKVGPLEGLPVTVRDTGYSSYEKSLSEKFRGSIPKRVMSTNKMAIRVAHTFATGVVDKLVDGIVACHDKGLSDLQTYNRVFEKFSDICSDHIIRASIKKIYSSLESEHE